MPGRPYGVSAPPLREHRRRLQSRPVCGRPRASRPEVRRNTMEAQTATTPNAAATGSKTLADLLPLAVEKHADKVAQRYKDQSKGEWVDVSYPELGEIAKEVSLGLQELGIDRGHKVGILANTRPEWTYADFGILATGATVVPIYQTNSPEECEYVLNHSESDRGDPRGPVPARQDPQGPGRAAEPPPRHLDGAARRRRRDQPRRASREGARAAPTRTTGSASRRSRAPTSRPTSTRRAPPARPRAA